MQFTEWGPELADALAEPFAPEAHQTKRQGGSEITFVSVHHYKTRLNATVGPHGWECRVRLEDHTGKLVCVCSLTILGVTKENVGDEDEEKDSYGTASTNSYSQAFKRTASDFGLGAYLYDKAGREAATRSKPAARQAPAPSGNPWDKVMPFGKGKGQKLGELSVEALSATITWCQQKDAEKFADLIQACADTIDHKAAA